MYSVQKSNKEKDRQRSEGAEPIPIFLEWTYFEGRAHAAHPPVSLFSAEAPLGGAHRRPSDTFSPVRRWKKRRPHWKTSGVSTRVWPLAHVT